MPISNIDVGLMGESRLLSAFVYSYDDGARLCVYENLPSPRVPFPGADKICF